MIFLANKNTYNLVFIDPRFFTDHPHLIEMLDPNNIPKSASRKYLFLNITYNGNNIYIPLRTEKPDLSIGAIGFPVPSQTRPHAGLDYRKILIINDTSYISTTQCHIASAQKKILNDNYNRIESEVIAYINGYIKSAVKGRHKTDSKFKWSTLHNFHDELGIPGLIAAKLKQPS